MSQPLGTGLRGRTTCSCSFGAIYTLGRTCFVHGATSHRWDQGHLKQRPDRFPTAEAAGGRTRFPVRWSDRTSPARPPRTHRVFVLSGKQGGTRAGSAHSVEAQQPGDSPGVGGGGRCVPACEQAPLSLSGQHTPQGASWKTCHVGQVLSSDTSSCLTHSSRRGGGLATGMFADQPCQGSGSADSRPLAAGNSS